MGYLKLTIRTHQYIVNVSSRAIHNFAVTPNNPNYNLTKNSGSLLLQQIAKDISPEKLQIISFHPGTIFTDAARKAGYNQASLAWNDGKLYELFVQWTLKIHQQFLIPLLIHKQTETEMCLHRRPTSSFCCLGCVARSRISTWPFCLVWLGCG